MSTPNAARSASHTCRLIVNADDFGKSPAANAAIQRTAEQGILTSTTVMANMPDAQGVVALQAACPALSIGLHINLTEGRPLLPSAAVPSLVDAAGHFWSIGQFLRRVWTGRIQRQQMRAEISAQLTWLTERIGHVSHLDSHQHIHSRSLHVLQEVLRVGAAHGVKRIRSNRRSFVSSHQQPSSAMRLQLRHFRTSPLGVAGLALTAVQNVYLRRYGYLSPHSILTPFPAITSVAPDAAAQLWARTLLRAPQQTVETIFHPGGGPQYEGQAELLCHQALQAAIQAREIALVNYAEIS